MNDTSRWLHPHILKPQPGLPRSGDNLRLPNDGKPYYCTFCGSGFNEYSACEDVRCVLETIEQAQKRISR